MLILTRTKYGPRAYYVHWYCGYRWDTCGSTLASRVAHTRVHTYDRMTLLCVCWDIIGRGDVKERDMSFHIKFAASKIRLSY